MGRKLLFFFDGSGNFIAGRKRNDPTNVYYLNQAFTNGKQNDQISFYFAGVGTHGDWFAAVTGRGFDQIVTEAYTNLSSNYVEGDEIYLFGFSRGAAAARVLSAMLSYPGLLKDRELSAGFPDAWELFTQFAQDTLSNNEQERLEHNLEGRLVQPAPRVNFIGVFDTVPGVSWDRRRMFVKLRVRDQGLEKCVAHAVQILAADDNRLPSFAPLLWDKLKGKQQTVEQIWMPGVHGDVGGHSDARFIGNLSLLTMIERIQHYCPELELDEEYIGWLRQKTFPPDGGVKVHITSERPDLGDKLLWRGERKPWVTPPPPMLPGVCKHEFLERLQGKEITVRTGSPRAYACHPEFADLPVFPSKYSAEIAEVLARVPPYTGADGMGG